MKALTVISAEDEFLGSLELERVRAAWEAKGYAVEEIADFDASVFFYALETRSLFGGGRFVVVRASASELDAVADRIAAWAADPPPDVACCLVTGKASKLRKALGTRAEVIDVPAPKPWESADWLVRHVKARGRQMTRDAAEALVEALGSDLRELASAADVLTTATSGSITVEVVGRFYRGLESQLYTFLDAVLMRDRSAALRHVTALLRSGMHPLQINLGLAKQFRALAAIRDGAPGGQPAALAKELDVSAGNIKRAQRHGRNFDREEIRRAFRALADADLALKGGERGEETPDELIVEMLVSDLTGEGRPAPRARARR